MSFPMKPKPEPKLVVEQTTDLTALDLKAITKYQDDGLPGVSSMTDTTLVKALELYLAGKSYREISQLTCKPKSMILYVAQKYDWYLKRQEYLREIQDNMIQRTLEAKIVGQDFLIQIKQFFEKKIGNNMNNYLRTDNEAFAALVDLKEIDKYIKTFEALDKLTTVKAPRSDKPAAPTVGLNMGDTGVTVTRTGDDTVEITPNQKPKSLLEKFAEDRRKEAEKSLNDIKKNKSEGDSK